MIIMKKLIIKKIMKIMKIQLMIIMLIHGDNKIIMITRIMVIIGNNKMICMHKLKDFLKEEEVVGVVNEEDKYK